MAPDLDSAITPSEGEVMMMLGDGLEEGMQSTDLFFGTSPMTMDLEETDLLEALPHQSGLNITPIKIESGNNMHSGRQTDSSPEESSEDSSSDDSSRHKRKSSSMSFETSNDGETYSFGKIWADGDSILGPALQSNGLSHTSIQDIGTEFNNEDMEIHFDFQSAASSPRPFTAGNPRSVLSSTPSARQQGYEPTQKCESSIEKMSAVRQTSLHTVVTNDESGVSEAAGTNDTSFEKETVIDLKRHHHPSRPGLGSEAHRSSPQMSPIQDPVALIRSLKPRSHLIIHPIPSKSRVETQIPIKITLFPVPEGVKKLHLPTHTISKPKLVQRPSPEKSPDTLELFSMLVCTSAMQDPRKRERALRIAASKTREQEELEKESPPKAGPYEPDHPSSPLNGGEVHICSGCITRERKRAARKKSKKPDEEAAWANDEARRVVVFNTQEIRPWDELEDDSDAVDNEFRGRIRSSGSESARQIKMPMRIACYCRHHGEKLGFQVIITVKDYQDNLVAQDISQPIVITDDHKAQPPATPAPATDTPSEGAPLWMAPEFSTAAASMVSGTSPLQRNAFSSNDLQAFQQQLSRPSYSQPGFRPFASAHTTAYNAVPVARPNRSRQASPSTVGPTSKKRKSSAGSKIPESLVMTKTQASPVLPNVGVLGVSTSVPYHSRTSNTTSPFSSHFSPQALPSNQQRTPPFPSGPPTPDSSTNDFFTQLHRSQSFETNAATQPIFSQPPSAIPSRAPSPASLAHMQGGPTTLQRAVATTAYAGSLSQVHQRSAVINKVIPAQGPISGGIEVTCLGSGFHRGIEVMFGDALATTTTYWGESTLVCLLPPADRPGHVPVTLKHQYEQMLNGTRHSVNASFTYVDGSEQDILRQALVILGQKITGRVEDAGDIIRHVLPSSQASARWNSYGSNGRQHNQPYNQSFGFPPDTCTEDAVLKCLDLIDKDTSLFPAQLDLTLESGQTLLHLAASLGYHRLSVDLIARGAVIDKCDRNGFSPMHMASLRGHAKIVRRLRLAGGNPNLRSHLGFSPVELATDPLVVRSLGVFLQSRADHRQFNSMSMRQSTNHTYRWQPTPPRSRTQSLSRYDASDEWDETSSEEDVESTSPAHADHCDITDLTQIDSGRKSAGLMRTSKSSPSPATAVDWRDHLAAHMHQIQQSMEGLFSPLQLPNLSTLPPMPNLPTYHAPAVVRRFSNLVPQRPRRSVTVSQNSVDGKDMENKWWDFFTGSQSPQASPPAYEDIYPHNPGSMDHKAGVVSSIASDDKTSNSPKQAGLRRKTVIENTGVEIDAQTRTTKTKRKRLRSDRNLFFIWIPLLLILIIIALKDRVSARWLSARFLFDRIRSNEPQIAEAA